MFESTFMRFCLILLMVFFGHEAVSKDDAVKEKCLAASQLYPEFSKWIVAREADPSDPVEFNEYLKYVDGDSFFQNIDPNYHVGELREYKLIENLNTAIYSFSLSNCDEEDQIKEIWYKINSYAPEGFTRVVVRTNDDQRIRSISYEFREFEKELDEGLMYERY